MVAHLCAKYKHLICIPPLDPHAKSIVPLTQAQLHVGMPKVQRASLALGRIVNKPTTWSYLQRNAHLVSHAKQVLAFGRFDFLRKHVEGGVGWTVQMAKQRDILLFVFDLDYEEWWYWDPQWTCFPNARACPRNGLPCPRWRALRPWWAVKISHPLLYLIWNAYFKMSPVLNVFNSFCR